MNTTFEQKRNFNSNSRIFEGYFEETVSSAGSFRRGLDSFLYIIAAILTALTSAKAIALFKVIGVASALVGFVGIIGAMETGAISEKIDRGKHTTRHSELFALDEETYILDTPGFSSLSIFDMEKEALEAYYEEFQPLTGGCKFTGCSHIHEPVCGVKEGLKNGKVSAERYENYKLIYQELAQKKKY